MNPRVLYRAATYATDARSTADSVISALTPAAWYRNATGVTEAGGFASQWDDYSGNGRHLIQGTATNQPAYSAGVLTFDGADNFMLTGAFAFNQPGTIIAVFSQVGWTSGDRIWDGRTPNTCMAYQVAASPNINVYSGADVSTNPDPSIGTRAILAAVYNGASSSARVNNNAKVTGNAGAANATGLCIGASGIGGSQWANITVEEVILFPSALSDANQDAVITALNNALTVF